MLLRQGWLLNGEHHQVNFLINLLHILNYLTFFIEFRGLQKWIDRMAWVISTYVEERQKVQNNIELDLEVENMFSDAYNYFIRYVIILNIFIKIT